MIELEQRIYRFENAKGYDEKMLLLVKEQEGESISWKPLAKGWE